MLGSVQEDPEVLLDEEASPGVVGALVEVEQALGLLEYLP